MERRILKLILPVIIAGMIFTQSCGTTVTTSIKDDMYSLNEKRLKLSIDILDTTWQTNLSFGGNPVEFVHPKKEIFF